MRQERFPGLPEQGVTLTFERADALVHEDREFLTWEHPMVRGAMDLLVSDELGTTALTLARHPGFRPGTLLLELLYLVECPAPAALQVRRFLPPTLIRLLLDSQGQDHAADLPEGVPAGRCLAGERTLARTLLTHLGGTLRALIDLGQGRAEGAGRQLAEKALARMHRELDEEWARLHHLARLNPNVRPEELEQITTRRAALEGHLGDTGVRLDALRVIVMS